MPEVFTDAFRQGLRELGYSEGQNLTVEYRSYGASLRDVYRRVAVLVDKILKGDMPGELPVEQVTKLYLVINLKTAQVQGLTIPPTLLFRADEVIR